MGFNHLLHLRSNLFHAAEFALWARIHTLPRFYIRWWQGRELRRLVFFAYRCSPIYRKLWDEYGVRLEDIHSIFDIQRLPITTKKLFKQYSPEELIGAPQLLHGYFWKETSGSTGEPFRFPTSQYKIPQYERNPYRRSIFYEYRFLLWRGSPLRSILDDLKIARIDYNPPSLGFSISGAELREDPAAVCQRLKEFNPDILRAVPTLLFEFGEYLQSVSPTERLRPRFIYSCGEMLTPRLRNFFEEIYGGEVYNAYGLEEVGTIAVECRLHDGFHLNEESAVVEVVDDDGNIIENDELGRVIVTRFSERIALPFIRYDTGDRGIVSKELCSCGLKTKKLYVCGRTGGFITIGTKRFHRYEFEILLNGFGTDILRYQLVKMDSKRVELRIIPAGSFSPITVDNLRERFAERFGFEPEIKIVNEIPFTERGKTPVVISEISDDTAIGFVSKQ